MSTTSISYDSAVSALPPGYGGAVGNQGSKDADYRVSKLAFIEWRKPALESLVLFAVITALQRGDVGIDRVLGLPHPYWVPVLLASCQYGLGGGVIAALMASLLYWFWLSPPSGAQDFYEYAAMAAIQPATWLATALVLGGLRKLHIHQSAELTNQLAVCRRRADDLGVGLARSAAEINALERRIAVDMQSVAALSRSLSLLDMRDRRTAAKSYGELFRVGTGTATFTIYLKGREGYMPVWAVDENVACATKSRETLSSIAMDAMIAENAAYGAEDNDLRGSKRSLERYVVRVPPADHGAEQLAAIVCDLRSTQGIGHFRRRADELSRALAAILHACPDRPRGSEA
jgi:K+-sensing histidine kinase KdpD